MISVETMMKPSSSSSSSLPLNLVAKNTANTSINDNNSKQNKSTSLVFAKKSRPNQSKGFGKTKLKNYTPLFISNDNNNDNEQEKEEEKIESNSAGNFKLKFSTSIQTNCDSSNSSSSNNENVAENPSLLPLVNTKNLESSTDQCQQSHQTGSIHENISNNSNKNCTTITISNDDCSTTTKPSYNDIVSFEKLLCDSFNDIQKIKCNDQLQQNNKVENIQVEDGIINDQQEQQQNTDSQLTSTKNIKDLIESPILNKGLSPRLSKMIMKSSKFEPFQSDFDDNNINKLSEILDFDNEEESSSAPSSAKVNIKNTEKLLEKILDKHNTVMNNDSDDDDDNNNTIPPFGSMVIGSNRAMNMLKAATSNLSLSSLTYVSPNPIRRNKLSTPISNDGESPRYTNSPSSSSFKSFSRGSTFLKALKNQSKANTTTNNNNNNSSKNNNINDSNNNSMASDLLSTPPPSATSNNNNVDKPAVIDSGKESSPLISILKTSTDGTPKRNRAGNLNKRFLFKDPVVTDTVYFDEFSTKLKPLSSSESSMETGNNNKLKRKPLDLNPEPETDQSTIDNNSNDKENNENNDKNDDNDNNENNNDENDTSSSSSEVENNDSNDDGDSNQSTSNSNTSASGSNSGQTSSDSDVILIDSLSENSNADESLNEAGPSKVQAEEDPDSVSDESIEFLYSSTNEQNPMSEEPISGPSSSKASYSTNTGTTTIEDVSHRTIEDIRAQNWKQIVHHATSSELSSSEDEPPKKKSKKSDTIKINYRIQDVTDVPCETGNSSDDDDGSGIEAVPLIQTPKKLSSQQQSDSDEVSKTDHIELAEIAIDTDTDNSNHVSSGEENMEDEVIILDENISQLPGDNSAEESDQTMPTNPNTPSVGGQEQEEESGIDDNNVGNVSMSSSFTTDSSIIIIDDDGVDDKNHSISATTKISPEKSPNPFPLSLKPLYTEKISVEDQDQEINCVDNSGFEKLETNSLNRSTTTTKTENNEESDSQKLPEETESSNYEQISMEISLSSSQKSEENNSSSSLSSNIVQVGEISKTESEKKKKSTQTEQTNELLKDEIIPNESSKKSIFDSPVSRSMAMWEAVYRPSVIINGSGSDDGSPFSKTTLTNLLNNDNNNNNNYNSNTGRQTINGIGLNSSPSCSEVNNNNNNNSENNQLEVSASLDRPKKSILRLPSNESTSNDSSAKKKRVIFSEPVVSDELYFDCPLLINYGGGFHFEFDKNRKRSLSSDDDMKNLIHSDHSTGGGSSSKSLESIFTDQNNSNSSSNPGFVVPSLCKRRKLCHQKTTLDVDDHFLSLSSGESSTTTTTSSVSSKKDKDHNISSLSKRFCSNEEDGLGNDNDDEDDVYFSMSQCPENDFMVKQNRPSSSSSSVTKIQKLNDKSQRVKKPSSTTKNLLGEKFSSSSSSSNSNSSNSSNDPVLSTACISFNFGSNHSNQLFEIYTQNKFMNQSTCSDKKSSKISPNDESIFDSLNLFDSQEEQIASNEVSKQESANNYNNKQKKRKNNSNDDDNNNNKQKKKKQKNNDNDNQLFEIYTQNEFMNPSTSSDKESSNISSDDESIFDSLNLFDSQDEPSSSNRVLKQEPDNNNNNKHKKKKDKNKDNNQNSSSSSSSSSSSMEEMVNIKIPLKLARQFHKYLGRYLEKFDKK